MASANVLEEDSFLTRLESVRVELKDTVSGDHQVLQEIETLLSELQELEDRYKINQLIITKEENIAALEDDENTDFLDQNVPLLNAHSRELENNEETAKNLMWDRNLEGILSRIRLIRVRVEPEYKRNNRKYSISLKNTLRSIYVNIKKFFGNFHCGNFLRRSFIQLVRRKNNKQKEFICLSEANHNALLIDDNCEDQHPTQDIPQLAINSEDKPIRGLKNLGNTCFMNSALQCLSHTLPLRQFYVSDEYKQFLNYRGDLSNAFKRVMVELWGTTLGDYVAPHELKRQLGKVAPRFIGYSQQDAHEYMRFLLNELHEEINRASVEGRKSPADNETLKEACARNLTWEDSRISELFGGMLRSDVCCSVCKNQSTVYIPFMDIALPIPERKQRSYHIYSKSSDPAVHLSDCIKMLTTEETLDEEERPYCNKCMNLTKSTKQLNVSKLPGFLVIQLKRFSYYPKRTKLSTPVEFDETWKVSDIANRTHAYSLYGIVCHSGSIFGGHYIAYCNYNGTWRCFNDTMARCVSWEHVKDQEAYVLFYSTKL